MHGKIIIKNLDIRHELIRSEAQGGISLESSGLEFSAKISGKVQLKR